MQLGGDRHFHTGLGKLHQHTGGAWACRGVIPLLSTLIGYSFGWYFQKALVAGNPVSDRIDHLFLFLVRLWRCDGREATLSKGYGKSAATVGPGRRSTEWATRLGGHLFEGF